MGFSRLNFLENAERIVLYPLDHGFEEVKNVVYVFFSLVCRIDIVYVVPMLLIEAFSDIITMFIILIRNYIS